VSDRDEFQNRLYELVLRYLFFATDDECRIMRPIIDIIDMDTSTWLKVSKHVDAQDSRLILGTYIKDLSCDNKTLSQSRSPFLMLRLILPSGHVDSQDLFPDVIRLTLEYAWAATDRQDSSPKVICFIQGAFKCLL